MFPPVARRYRPFPAGTPQVTESSRTVTIPLALCKEFEAKVVNPWQAAWRAFRASKARVGRAEAGSAQAGTDAEGKSANDGAEDEGEVVKEEVSGDTLFSWGCLDWISSQAKAADKNNVRSAFIVSHPDLLDLGRDHPLHSAAIVQVAAGGRHNLVRTLSGHVYGWGRGVSGCLGVGSTGCTGRPQLLAALKLGKVQIVSISCGGEHSALLSKVRVTVV